VGKSILEKRPCLIPAGVASIMLFLALAPWPYGYYQLLRFVVCGVSAYMAFMAYTWQKNVGGLVVFSLYMTTN